MVRKEAGGGGGEEGEKGRGGGLSAACAIEACGWPAYRAGLCRGHYERKRLGLPVDVELERRGPGRGRSAWEVLWDAVLHVNDLRATDDDGWERARERVRMAAVRYVRSLPSEKRKGTTQ